MQRMEPIKREKWRAKKLAKFEKTHGYKPDLEHPKLFTEKLIKRIIESDDAQYPLYGVKLFAHHFVQSRAIEGLKFTKRLKVLKRLTPSDFADLPDAFAIKSSFGSGLNEIVRDKSKLDLDAVCKRFNKNLHKIRNAQNLTDSNNVIIIEEFLGDPESGPPTDYKFHCFHKQDGSFDCVIHVVSDRLVDRRQSFFDQNFTHIDMEFLGRVAHDTPPERPATLNDMLRIAEELSRGFDYIRVDLYSTDEGIVFGEMTPFHQAATAPLVPREWDVRLGAMWEQRFPIYQPQEHGN